MSCAPQCCNTVLIDARLTGIAIGYRAATHLLTGINNIDMGTEAGAAAEQDTIRIGTKGQQKDAYVQGTQTVSVTALRFM